jgi:hypothetical protein
MFGLEKEKKKFAFDLEKELKEKPGRSKEILKDVEDKVHEIKTLLRKGSSGKEFDKLGVLLLGYTTLQKVLKKAAKS